jgi:thiol-disulfide isomerase/thioredoxin
MRSCLLLLLSIFTIITTSAQIVQAPVLNIGDPAPPLRVKAWLKGAPVERFQKGRIYVVEFWATWCGPCVLSIPHLTALARQYKDQVTVIGIDILEKKSTPIQKVKAFVDSMGSRMDYAVAAEDNNFMQLDWLKASGEEGIPCAYVVDEEGRLAWIGYPMDMDKALAAMVNHTLDVKEVLAHRNEQMHLEALDRAAMETFRDYTITPEKEDSIPIVVNEILQKEPRLKYAPVIAFYTFESLLKTDPHKAYEYGKQVLVTPSYTGPALGSIIGAMDWYGDKLNLPAEIYELAAEACQAEIDLNPSGKKSFKFYHKMAGWYFCAGNRAKAIEAEQKAIEDIKTGIWGKQADVATYEAILQQYKGM